MRTVALFAAILALPCGLFADEPPSSDIHLTISPPVASPADVSPAGIATSENYDTSVYHLQHARARQIIPAVRQALCKSLTAEAADQPQGHSALSVVFMPTTSDDTLVAICPRERAALVKQTIEACDVEKQYAVRVQLFEMAPNGETVPVGAPALIVGRKGSVECVSSAHCSVTLKLQVNDGSAVAAEPSTETLPVEPRDGSYCSGPDCGRSCGRSEGDESCETTAASLSCSEPASDCACEICSGECPASCKGKCAACEGQCPACHVEYPACPAASKVESAAASAEACPGCCESCGGSSSDSKSLTGDEYRVLVRILVQHWLSEHQEHVGGLARDEAAAAETSDCCSEHDSSSCDKTILGAPAIACPEAAPPTAEAPPSTDQTAAPCDDPVPTVMETSEEGRLFVHGAQCNEHGFGCGEGCRFHAVQHEKVVTSTPPRGVSFLLIDAENPECGAPVASAGEHCDSQCPCDYETAGSCRAPSAEPPALLTLAPHKENAAILGVAVSPRWQSELSKIYQGRRLSEIFEPHNGQDPSAQALGRLLAEIPKPGCENEGENSQHRNVIVVDLPDRIRVFETPGEGHGTTTCAPSCSSCREQFRAFLEEAFRDSTVLEEIAQAGHTQESEAAPQAPRELPSVAQSKLETTVVTYPLRDLVVMDDAERPVFDTCTIIDHIQGAVAPESWWHPSVSIQLDQQSMSLVIRQTPDVHKKIASHLRDLRRLQVKHLCNLMERLSAEIESTDD